MAQAENKSHVEHQDLALNFLAGISVPPLCPLSQGICGCLGWGGQPQPQPQGFLKVYIAVALWGEGDGSPRPYSPAPPTHDSKFVVLIFIYLEMLFIR